MSQDSKAQKRQQRKSVGAVNRAGGSDEKGLNTPNRPAT